jgi:hypothetical protein
MPDGQQRQQERPRPEPQQPQGLLPPQWQEKEAGAAGGESGARSYGPALGGEAGAVLMGKLIRKVLPYATTSVVFAITGGVSATVTRCGVSQSNYNICGRV